jgi:zinc protease
MIVPPQDPGDSIARALSRGTRRTDARFTHEATTPFGDALVSRRYRMGNGLEVLTLVERSAPVVSFMSWYRVGSRHEKPGKTGLAHLFEHLMFSGTKKRPAGTFDRVLERAGAETNAATWVDWTQYYENVPKKSLELAVDIEADRMQNLVLDDVILANEKDVVVNERKMRVDDDVDGMANEVLYRNAFRVHPYGSPTIGSMADIVGTTRADCEHFYATYYAPNNATLVIAGDFDEQDALAMVQAKYGHMKAARLPREETPVEPRQRAERFVKLALPTTTEKLILGYKAPSLGHDTHALTLVLSEIIAGGRSARLVQALVHDEELATEVSGSVSPFRDPGLFELFIQLRPGEKATSGLKLTDRILDRLAKEGPTEAELDKAKNRIELSFLSGMETASGKGEQLGFFHVVTGDIGAIFGQLAIVRAATPARIRTLAAGLLRANNRTRVHVVPAKRRK